MLVEGIYSLDGDKAHLAEFVEICERYDAVLVVDDAHGTGTLGERGTGILEETGLAARVPVVVSTFSKTFGGIGGILLGSEEVVDLVKHNARSFLFSASLPVPIVAAASTILDMLEDDGPAMVRELHQKADYFRGKLTGAGFDLGTSNTHIMPVMCREERKTLFMHVALLECGVLMVPITYPAVKHGEERLRVNVTRGHTQEDMDTALDLLKTYGEAFFVLSGEDIGPMEDERPERSGRSAPVDEAQDRERRRARPQLHERLRDVLDGRDVAEDVVRDRDREAILDVGDDLHHAEAVEPEIVLDVIVRPDRTLGVDVLLQDLGRDLQGLVVRRHDAPKLALVTAPATGGPRRAERRSERERHVAHAARVDARRRARGSPRRRRRPPRAGGGVLARRRRRARRRAVLVRAARRDDRARRAIAATPRAGPFPGVAKIGLTSTAVAPRPSGGTQLVVVVRGRRDDARARRAARAPRRLARRASLRRRRRRTAVHAVGADLARERRGDR